MILLLPVAAQAQGQSVTGGLGHAVMDRAAQAQTGTITSPSLPGEEAMNSPSPIPPSMEGEMASPPGEFSVPDSSQVAIPDLLPGGIVPNSQVIDKVNKDVEDEVKRLGSLSDPAISVMFTESEQAALRDAIAVYQSGNWKIPAADVSVDSDSTGLPPIEFKVGRELKLSGISFGNGENWVIWLNNQRLTSTRLPPEIRDIRVYKSYIEIRWFDRLTNAEVPIRLRLNQRFNLDTRSFLPG